MGKYEKFFRQLFCRHTVKVMLFSGKFIRPDMYESEVTIYACEKCLMILELNITNEIPDEYIHPCR